MEDGIGGGGGVVDSYQGVGKGDRGGRYLIVFFIIFFFVLSSFGLSCPVSLLSE